MTSIQPIELFLGMLGGSDEPCPFLMIILTITH